MPPSHLITLHVEVFELFEVLALVNEVLESRRVVASAIPRARGIAVAVGGVCHPLLRFFGHFEYLENADFVVLGREDFTESLRINRHARALVVAV
jgi:hypothetical protein